MKRITFSLPWPLSAHDTRELLSFVFQVALVSYLGLYLIESLRPGFVTFYYNLNSFLWVAILTGTLSSLWPAIVVESKKIITKPTWKDCIWMGILALGTVAVVSYKVSSIGWLVTIVAPLSGLIVFGVSMLVFYDYGGDPESSI